MKTKILLVLLNSKKPLQMSEIAEKSKSDIQLCNYHLKKMVSDKMICCIEKKGIRKYSVHPIVTQSSLYNDLFDLMTQYVPEYYEELSDKKVMVECIRQVLLKVLNDIETMPDE